MRPPKYAICGWSLKVAEQGVQLQLRKMGYEVWNHYYWLICHQHQGNWDRLIGGDLEVDFFFRKYKYFYENLEKQMVVEVSRGLQCCLKKNEYLEIRSCAKKRIKIFFLFCLGFLYYKKAFYTTKMAIFIAFKIDIKISYSSKDIEMA